jgi:hypothetical protein
VISSIEKGIAIQMALGICKLCGQSKNLIKAHIIPEAFFKLSKQNQAPMALIGAGPGGISIKSPLGPYDQNILCEPCDCKILNEFDEHAIKTMLNSSNKVKLRRNDMQFIAYKDADPNLIQKFVASVIWRAAVSSHLFYRQVKLGPYEAILRNYILGHGSFELNRSILVVEYDFHLELPTTGPFNSKIDNLNLLRLQANRFEFYLKLDQRPFPSVWADVCIEQNKEIQSCLTDWPSSPHFKQMKEIVNKKKRPKFWK